MAITAATKTSDFSGFLTREQSEAIFEKAAQQSVVQRLARRVPLGINGQSIPVVTGKVSAGWVAEGAQKPASEGSIALKTMDPKKLAAIAVVSAEVVRANPGGYMDLLRPQIADAFAVAFDAAAVVASDVMPTVRSFTIEPGALVCACHGRPDERVEFPDLVALVRAVHQTRTESTSTTKQTSVSLGRLALSGGLMLTKTVTKETKKSTDEREAVLYLFRRVGKPVLFGATRARYAGLGVDVRPTQAENFERVIALLRERAPDAAYDARLVALRVGVREKASLAGTGVSGPGATPASSAKARRRVRRRCWGRLWL